MNSIIDLVAVAYQAPKETERFLGSLRTLTVPFTLSVIENHSPDETVRTVISKYLEQSPPSSAVWQEAIFMDGNYGYAKAINYGVHLGDAPYIAALNCDIEVLPGCVEEIIRYFDEHSDVGVIGPRTTDSGGRFTHAGITNAGHGSRDLHRGWQNTDRGQFQDVIDVPTVSGATYFVRRSVWDELTACQVYQDEIAPECEGAFLPTQHFYEETWCSYHARAHGHRVVYLGTAHMIHQWHKSSAVGSIPLDDAEEQFRRACKHHDIELTW